jgi:molecular chaperone GrpE
LAEENKKERQNEEKQSEMKENQTVQTDDTEQKTDTNPGGASVEEAEEKEVKETKDVKNPKVESSEESDQKADESDQKSGNKGFFKKKEKKDPKDEKIADLTDRLQRQFAEFDNFRKRTEKEKASMYHVGAKDVIEKILPVVDNFERALDAGDPEDPFVDGMNKIYKQMFTVLTDLGVKPIETVGKEFDANLHNAVMHVEDESVGENTIVEEFQKGYTYEDSVVRHSMVKVAN